ncbi:MAG: 4Fe-4S binding protein [Candidatus Bathyarchaeota archaeon]|nr:4Fe-4S binding protein [Candidatus Bathyarchaeota archaeon]
MDTHRSPILIDYAKCSPCQGLICVGVCPLSVFEPGADGKPEPMDAASCTQCGVCAHLCPTKAITVNTRQTSKRQTMVTP